MSDSNIIIRDNHIVGRGTREWIVHASHCSALSHYDIGLIGISDAAAEFQFTRANPAIVQLLACTGGAGEVMIDGEWRRCGAGEAYVTPAGAPHAYRALPDIRWRLCWVMYSAPRWSTPVPAIEKPTLVSGSFQALSTSIEALYHESRGASDPGISFNLASLIHAYAQRSLVPRTRLAVLWDTVRDDLSRKWSVVEMADFVHVSPEHLRRLSEQEVGESPMRYLTRIRMREAAALLFSDSYKMQEVAERIGYDNVFAFSTAFKRCFGQAPSDYRARLGTTKGR
ncbi:MAG: AraC family transcriptional regulator [Capsulimonadaceae bacterium]|nr:AraC family transcriptional regulator [Capsulimonadaceae bacterium]